MSLHGPYMNQTLPEQELTDKNSKAITVARIDICSTLEPVSVCSGE